MLPIGVNHTAKENSVQVGICRHKIAPTLNHVKNNRSAISERYEVPNSFLTQFDIPSTSPTHQKTVPVKTAATAQIAAQPAAPVTSAPSTTNQVCNTVWPKEARITAQVLVIKVLVRLE